MLITGAGPIGILAAMLGSSAATMWTCSIRSAVDPDILIEATGVGGLVFGAMQATASYGVVCLTGVSPKGRILSVEAGSVNREIVLEDDATIGSVNANLCHYRDATACLAQADVQWLESLVSRRVPLTDFVDAFPAQEDDVKVVIALGGPESSRD